MLSSMKKKKYKMFLKFNTFLGKCELRYEIDQGSYITILTTINEVSACYVVTVCLAIYHKSPCCNIKDLKIN